jgi:UPF0716 protein FxsA
VIFFGLLIWLAAEIVVFIEVARAIGFLLALIVLLATSFIGSALLRREGARAFLRIRETVAAGRSPAAEITNGSLVLVGAGLLLVPGFIGDAFGLLLLIPGTRHALGWFVRRRVRRRIGAVQRAAGGRGRSGRRSARGQVIDGEAVEKRPPGVENTPPTSGPED